MLIIVIEVQRQISFTKIEQVHAQRNLWSQGHDLNKRESPCHKDATDISKL